MLMKSDDSLIVLVKNKMKHFDGNFAMISDGLTAHNTAYIKTFALFFPKSSRYDFVLL